MARTPKRILPDRLYEATLSTFQHRFFFVPTKRLREVVVGALAYAQEKYAMRVCFATFLSSHGHVLLWPDAPNSADQVKSFFQLANSQIAKEVGKLCGWTGGIFQGPPDITEIVGEEAQVQRFTYLMSQGVKEGLCPTPDSWPGVQSAGAWINGSMAMRGTWVHRSRLYELGLIKRKVEARRKKLTLKQRRACEEKKVLRLSPLPCWAHLPPAELRKKAQAVRAGILEQYEEKRRGLAAGWRKKLQDESWFTHRPSKVPKSPRPKVHAATIEEWVSWVRGFDQWLTDYERASKRLRRGIVAALREFPEGCYLPTGITLRGYDGLPPPRAAPAG